MTLENLMYLAKIWGKYFINVYYKMYKYLLQKISKSHGNIECNWPWYNGGYQNQNKKKIRIDPHSLQNNKQINEEVQIKPYKTLCFQYYQKTETTTSFHYLYVEKSRLNAKIATIRLPTIT